MYCVIIGDSVSPNPLLKSIYHMCILCKEYVLDKLKRSEAQRNFWEMVEGMDPEHVEDVFELIWNDDGSKKQKLQKIYKQNEVVK
tara:strand:+ start:5746 stop:6000 length:255 start_codon:yes stop_codon:yes gene_type:complete